MTDDGCQMTDVINTESNNNDLVIARESGRSSNP
jgi:hypothetical protein